MLVITDRKLSVRSAEAMDADKKPSKLSYQDFFATDGGRRCPTCGRFTKESDIVTRGCVRIPDGIICLGPTCVRCLSED